MDCWRLDSVQMFPSPTYQLCLEKNKKTQTLNSETNASDNDEGIINDLVEGVGTNIGK